MKMHRSILAACVAGSLLSGTARSGHAQEISQPLPPSRSSSDFSGLKSSKVGKVGSLSIRSGETIAARQSRISPKTLGTLESKGLVHARHAAIDRESALSQLGKTSSLKLMMFRKSANFNESLQLSKVSNLGKLSQSSAVSARRSKFRISDDSSSVSTDLFTQSRLVK